MPQQPFKLEPFDHHHPEVEISGEISRDGDRLRLFYQLLGDQDAIQLPERTAPHQRRDELWQHSCFEFFLGILGKPGYWEFNLSPSGDWNVYRLSDYRQGLTPEPAYAALPFNIAVSQSSYALILDLNLSQIVSCHQAIEVGITTVLEEKPSPEQETGRISYWAIAHTGPEADFHRRDSFRIHFSGHPIAS